MTSSTYQDYIYHMTGNSTPSTFGKFTDNRNVRNQLLIRIAIFLAIMIGIYFAYNFFHAEPVIQENTQSVVSTESVPSEVERLGFSS